MAEHGKAQSRPPRRVGVREFRGDFSGFMGQVRHGAWFDVTSRNEVIAVVRPPEPTERPRRRPGALRGRIVMAADFDEASPELLAALEGGGG